MPTPPSSDRRSRRGPLWDALTPLALPTPRALAARLPAANAPASEAAAQFEVLRTRAAAVLAERGWRRLGVTQASAGPAAAYAAINLALSLARRASQSVLLVDLDLRHPRLAEALALRQTTDLGAALREGAPLAQGTWRLGENLALVVNARPDPAPGEVLQEPQARAALAALEEGLAPDVTVLLLPPLREGDGGLVGLTLADTALLVVDGTRTTAAEVRACAPAQDGPTPFLGVILTDAEV